MATRPDESSNRLLEPKPNQPFSIHVPDSVWLVESGKLDLFLVRCENGELAGARHHFVRVDEGRAVFGMDSGGRDGTVIVATATPGTRLLCVSRDDLSKLGQSLASEKVWIHSGYLKTG